MKFSNDRHNKKGATKKVKPTMRNILPKFKSINIGGKKYPTIILGGDRFLDFWGPQKSPELALVNGVFIGVRGYDISVSEHEIDAFKLLKASVSEEVIGIGNPNWRCGIKLDDKIIYDLGGRIRRTLLNNIFTERELNQIKLMPQNRQTRWFGFKENDKPLTKEEINSIWLDETVYKQKLEKLIGIVDYILIGTDYADWLIPLGRADILSRMIEITLEYDFIPISISHWPSITLPILRKMGFKGHWVYLNKEEQLLNYEGTIKETKNTKEPITAFRILGGGMLANDINSAIRYLQKDFGIDSFVIGVEKIEQLEENMITIIVDATMEEVEV